MRYTTFISLCLVTATIVLAAPATPPLTTPPVVGDRAPDFSLETLDGKVTRLTELEKAGTVVVLELRGWVGYQCPLCNRQVGDFLGQAAAFRKAGAQVVLVYPGPAEGLKDHAQDFLKGKGGLPDNFTFVVDPNLKFVSDWGLRWDSPNETAYPSVFIVDTTGVVRFAKVSHSHGDRATALQVLAALAELR